MHINPMPANDREIGGINQAACKHDWAYSPLGGHNWYCQICLLAGDLEKEEGERICYCTCHEGDHAEHLPYPCICESWVCPSCSRFICTCKEMEKNAMNKTRSPHKESGSPQLTGACSKARTLRSR